METKTNTTTNKQGKGSHQLGRSRHPVIDRVSGHVKKTRPRSTKLIARKPDCIERNTSIPTDLEQSKNTQYNK